MWHCNERRSQAARTWRPADPAGPRFTAQRDGVSGRFRSSPTARYRPPGRGHACRSAVRCGARHGSTCAPEFTAFVARTLTGLGYDVAINDPYKGVELVRMHGRPAEQRHSLQVEINRRLYMDESTLARHSGFATLQSNLQRL